MAWFYIGCAVDCCYLWGGSGETGNSDLPLRPESCTFFTSHQGWIPSLPSECCTRFTFYIPNGLVIFRIADYIRVTSYCWFAFVVFGSFKLAGWQMSLDVLHPFALSLGNMTFSAQKRCVFSWKEKFWQKLHKRPTCVCLMCLPCHVNHKPYAMNKKENRIFIYLRAKSDPCPIRYWKAPLDGRVRYPPFSCHCRFLLSGRWFVGSYSVWLKTTQMGSLWDGSPRY